MPCDDFADRILEYQENELAARQRGAVEAHLAACAECREFLHQLRALDAALARDLTRPSLSAHFGERLAWRIKEQTPPAERVQARKRELEAEYRRGVNRLNRPRFELGGWAEQFGYALLGAILLSIALQFIPGLAQSGGALQAGGEMGLLPLVVSGLVLCFAVLVAFPRALRRLGSALV